MNGTQKIFTNRTSNGNVCDLLFAPKACSSRRHFIFSNCVRASMVVIESIVMEAVQFAIQYVFWANWTFVSSFAFGIAAKRSFRVAIVALLLYLSVDFCIHFSPPSLNRALPIPTNYRGGLHRCRTVKFSRLALNETELCPNDDQHIVPVSHEIDKNEIDAMNGKKWIGIWMHGTWHIWMDANYNEIWHAEVLGGNSTHRFF